VKSVSGGGHNAPHQVFEISNAPAIPARIGSCAERRQARDRAQAGDGVV